MVILLCFLHAWLKIRDRAKHLKELFAEVSRRVWEAYHAPDRRSFGQRLRRSGSGPTGHLSGVVLEKVLDLCEQARPVVDRVPPPRGHRTSNMLDRADARDEPLLRPRPTPARLARGLPAALPSVGVVVELRPWHPATTRENEGLAMPRRTAQPAPLPRLLAAKPVDLRVPGWIPMSTPPKSVTVRELDEAASPRDGGSGLGGLCGLGGAGRRKILV